MVSFTIEDRRPIICEMGCHIGCDGLRFGHGKKCVFLRGKNAVFSAIMDFSPTRYWIFLGFLGVFGSGVSGRVVFSGVKALFGAGFFREVFPGAGKEHCFGAGCRATNDFLRARFFSQHTRGAFEGFDQGFARSLLIPRHHLEGRVFALFGAEVGACLACRASSTGFLRGFFDFRIS